jgi:acetylornithine deacetylase/succinyl-diaminopimelate desuccinylase-like protein
VLLAGCELVRRLAELNTRLGFESHPITGPASTFVGKIVSGEIFNQSHTECRVEGTRRWLPGQNPDMIRDAFLTLVQELAADTRTTIDVEYQLVGRAFSLDTDHLLVRAFESAYQHVSRREPLAEGPKPFLDDGNHISARAGIPVITHGPNATGAHTTDERVPVSELYRVAATYALTARRFCGGAVEPN